MRFCEPDTNGPANVFSKDRSDQQALSERRKFLEMQGLIAKDIPPEVLANLPSPELIAKKSQRSRRASPCRS